MSFCNWKPMFSKLDDTLTCFATQYWLMTTYFWANDSSCSAALFRLCTFYCYKPSLFSGQVRFEIGVKWHQSGLRSYNMYRFIYVYIHLHQYYILVYYSMPCTACTLLSTTERSVYDSRQLVPVYYLNACTL